MRRKKIARVLASCFLILVLVALVLNAFVKPRSTVERPEGGPAAVVAGDQLVAALESAQGNEPRVVVLDEAANSDNDKSGALEPSSEELQGLATWRGRRRSEFLTHYWNVSEEELLNSLVESGLPLRVVERQLDQSVSADLVEWEQALPLIKAQMLDAIEEDFGNVEKAFAHAWSDGIDSFSARVALLLEQRYGVVAFGNQRVRELIFEWCNPVLGAHSQFLELQIAHGSFLLETDDVDRFPIMTVPQGRGRQRASAEMPPFYRYLSLSGGGWIAQFAICRGADPVLDQGHRLLRDSWAELILAAIQGQVGVPFGPEDLAQCGLIP